MAAFSLSVCVAVVADDVFNLPLDKCLADSQLGSSQANLLANPAQ